jgi:hypothetical protein
MLSRSSVASRIPVMADIVSGSGLSAAGAAGAGTVACIGAGGIGAAPVCGNWTPKPLAGLNGIAGMYPLTT